MELRGKGRWRKRGKGGKGCLKESGKAREAWCCEHLEEWGKETGGEWGEGIPVWSLRCYIGSDVSQSKHQKHSCVIPLTSLAYLWGLGFFFLLNSLLSFFSFSLSAFLFLPISSKSPRWFNASLTAFDSLFEARFVRARAVSFAVAVCFQWASSAACGYSFSSSV